MNKLYTSACVRDAANVIISLIMHFWLSKAISDVVLSWILFIINHFATIHYFPDNEKQNHPLSSEIKSQETSSFGKGAGEGVSAWQLPAWAAGPRGPREAGDGAALGSAVTHSRVSRRSLSAAEEAPLERATRRGRANRSGPAPRAKQACHAERSQQRAACKSQRKFTRTVSPALGPFRPSRPPVEMRPRFPRAVGAWRGGRRSGEQTPQLAPGATWTSPLCPSGQGDKGWGGG